jgi:hypothetical protein
MQFESRTIDIQTTIWWGHGHMTVGAGRRTPRRRSHQGVLGPLAAAVGCAHIAPSSGREGGGGCRAAALELRHRLALARLALRRRLRRRRRGVQPLHLRLQALQPCPPCRRRRRLRRRRRGVQPLHLRLQALQPCPPFRRRRRRCCQRLPRLLCLLRGPRTSGLDAPQRTCPAPPWWASTADRSSQGP